MLTQSKWQKRAKKNGICHRVKNGGPGSGNFGHLGRPGMVGGSGKGFSVSMRTKTFRVGDEVSFDTEGGRSRGIVQGSSGSNMIVDVDGKSVLVSFWKGNIKMERNVEDINGYTKKPSKKELQTEGQKKAIAKLAEKMKISDAVRGELEKNCSEECAKEILKNAQEAEELGINMSYYGVGQPLNNNHSMLGAFKVFNYYKGDGEWGVGRSVFYRKDALGGGEGVKKRLADLHKDGYFTGGDIASAIRHEFGHLIICEAYCRQYGREPEDSMSYDRFATEIVKRALGDSRAKMLNDKSNKSMSKYGRSDDGESIAESWANPDYSAETRKIHDELLKYLRMENAVRPAEVGEGTMDVVELCSGYPLDRVLIDKMCEERIWRESLGKISNAIAEERKETHSLVKMAPYGFCNGGPGSGNFGHVGRPGMVGGSGSGKNPVRIGKLADNGIANAKANEKATTQAVSAVAKACGGVMEGLEFRLKSKESLSRKIESDAIAKHISLERAAAGINDNLRYTTRFEDDGNFGKNFEKMKSALEKQGFDFVKVKNTMNNTKGDYKGVNCQVKNKDGYIFELQFHTKETLDAKMPAHKEYEISRDEKRPQAERDAADERCRAIYRAVHAPKGSETIESYDRREIK